MSAKEGRLAESPAQHESMRSYMPARRRRGVPRRRGHDCGRVRERREQAAALVERHGVGADLGDLLERDAAVLVGVQEIRPSHALRRLHRPELAAGDCADDRCG